MLKLLQGYYHFLSLGKFMEQVMMTNDLSDLAIDLPIMTGANSSFRLKESLIKKLLSTIYAHPQQRNLYGYLTEISAFRGIFSLMRELIENDAAFREFLKTTLKDQYFPFEQTIRFLRNVLNHTTSSGLIIKLEDYEIQKDFILSPKIQRVQKLKGSAKITLDFVYAEYISQRKGSENYGLKIELDFACLKAGLALEKLITWHDLYLLSELCFNLSQIAEHQLKVSHINAKKTDPVRKKSISSPAKKGTASAQKSKKSESPKIRKRKSPRTGKILSKHQ